MNKILWFHKFEKKIWGDNINTNKYYASISLIIAALAGAMVSASEIMNDIINTNINIDEDSIPWVIALIFLPNLAESIFSAKSTKIIILRSLLIAVFTVLAALIGFITSIVVALIASLLIILFAFSIITSGIGGSSSSSRRSRSPRSYAYDENGSEVTLTDEGGGYARDEYGHRWKNAGGTRWTKDE